MTKIISLDTARQKKETGRKPLYVSHGRVRGPDPDDFGDRLTRIRTSLEKINKLMAALKEQSKEKEK